MNKVITKIIVIIFCIYSLFFIIGSLISPIAAHFKNYELSAQMTYIFAHSCHQRPERTFWILGYPVALCCRCLGFYIGVVIGSILVLFKKLNFKFKAFVILALICVIDIMLNYIFNISTANFIRFPVGLTMGILFIVVLIYVCKKGENLWELRKS